MIRRKNSMFSRGNGYAFEDEKDVNPMELVANLSDVMLVFAVALMLAVVTHWNVDITKQLAQLDAEDMTALDEAQSEEAVSNSENDGYEDMGKAYRDPKTGEIYVIQESGSASTGGSGASGGSSGSNVASASSSSSSSGGSAGASGTTNTSSAMNTSSTSSTNSSSLTGTTNTSSETR